MKSKNRILSWITAVLGLILAIGTATAFRACAMKDDGTWMHCHTAQNAVIICGIIILVIFAAAALIKNRIVSIILHIAGIAAAIIAILIPGTIVRMCLMETMRCYTVMQPFVRIMGVVIIIVSAVGIIAAVRRSAS